MAIINSIENSASISYGGSTINSNTVTTILLLPPLIVKAVDKLLASIGEDLTYTITITNVGLSSITNLPFSDVIPEGSEYVTGSFTVNGTSATPTITGSTLSYTIPTVGILGTATITFQVEVVGGET